MKIIYFKLVACVPHKRGRRDPDTDGVPHAMCHSQGPDPMGSSLTQDQQGDRQRSAVPSRDIRYIRLDVSRLR